MRLALTCVVVLVSACSSSTTGGGGDDACSASVSCDTGFTCSITHTDDNSVGECLPNDGDIDGDGLANEKDFCNSSAGGEFDEDRDLIGDECDRCPIAPPQGADSDGDEVDAPCDPDSHEPGDKIVVFEGFRNGIPTAWKKTGTWEQRGGDVVVTTNAATPYAQLTTALPLVAQNMAVLVQYRMDTVDTTVGRNYVGLIARDERPGNVEEVWCGGQRTTGGDSLSVETKSAAGAEPIGDAFDSSSLYSVALRVQGLNAACAMIADNVTVAAQANTGGAALSEAGLFVQGGTARFQYLLVVQRSAN